MQSQNNNFDFLLLKKEKKGIFVIYQNEYSKKDVILKTNKENKKITIEYKNGSLDYFDVSEDIFEGIKKSKKGLSVLEIEFKNGMTTGKEIDYYEIKKHLE